MTDRLVTLEFSEEISPDDSSCGVEGLTNGDITVPNGLLSNGASTAVGDLSSLSTSDNETWTSTFTPEDDIEDDTNQLELRDGTYTDLAGNEGPAAQTANFLVDTRRPTAQFYMDDRHLKFGDNMTLYLEFSEPVMEFSNADITIPNLNQSPRHDGSVTSGTLSTMTLQSDNKTWVGIFVPTFPTTEDWTNTFTLGTNWKDLDNNTGTAATSPNYMIDDIPPSANGSTTITIQTNSSANDSLILYGQSATVTVTFPEPVNKYWGNVNKNESNNDVNDCNDDSTTATLNFDATDLDLDNATGTSSTITNGSFNGSDCNDTTWTATYTPPDDVEQPVNTITVKNTWYDQVGNQGVDNVTSVFDVETYRPRAVLTITHNHSDNFTCGNYHSNCNNKHGFRPGDNGTLTVTFTDLEPDIGIYGFTTSDITVPSYVNLSTMNITDSDNTTWSGTFTPIDNTTGGSGQSGSYNIRFGLPYNTYKDFKGNDGYATRYSPYFIADTKAPYVDFVELVHDGEEVTATNGMCMPIESNIKVNFDYIMEPNYIDTTTSGSNCAGSVNLSSDDISTCSPSSSCSCVTMTSEPTTPSSGSYQNIEYTLNPTDNLSSSTSYKVWVTTRARDALGNTFTSDHIHHELKSSAILPASDAEVFFAVAQSGKIFRSGDNGASWDNETCFTFKQLNGVAYGSNTFVAVGNSGRIERTTDNGVSWDTENTSGYNIFGIAFGQSKFIGVGDGNRIFDQLIVVRLGLLTLALIIIGIVVRGI